MGLTFSDKLLTIKKVGSSKIDLVSGSTLTGSIDWSTGVSSFKGSSKVSLLEMLFGEYQGAIPYIGHQVLYEVLHYFHPAK